MNKPFDKVSDSELKVLRVLWEAGDALPITEIRKTLCEETGWESSTVKTLVKRLYAKGAVQQEKREVYYYTPLITAEEFSRYATRHLIDKLYNGSVKSMVAALVDSELSEDDIAELRKIFGGGDKIE